MCDSLRRDEAHAAHQLDAGGDALDDGVAGEPAMLGGREHSGHDDRAGMHRAAFERVVVILAVRRRAVDERRVVGTEAAARARSRSTRFRDATALARAART